MIKQARDIKNSVIFKISNSMGNTKGWEVIKKLQVKVIVSIRINNILKVVVLIKGNRAISRMNTNINLTHKFRNNKLTIVKFNSLANLQTLL